MRTKQHIEVLLENGIHFNTISKMNKNQIRILAEKFETKEQSTIPQNTTAIQKPATTSYVVKPNSKTMINGIEIDTTGGKTTATPLKELGETSELDEKFESKAQQKLMFAKCGNGKTKEQKKWCKLRDEFARSTTKKDYKKMPEKLHPEKTVDYKKKRTDENYEEYLENRIFEMIEKHIEPSMTKGELLKTIQERVKKSESMILKNPPKNTMFSKDEGKEMKMKLPIGKLSSMSGEMKEDTKEKEAPTKPGIKTPGKKRNPHRDPAPGVKEKPKAEGDTEAAWAENRRADIVYITN